MRKYQTSNVKLSMAYDELNKTLEEAYRTRLWEATNLLRTHIVKSFSEKKHGKPYYIGKTKRLHIASAPGEAPGIWFGGLKRSITNKVLEEKGNLVGYVGVPDNKVEGKTLIWKYATWLEYGTRLMKPRPFLKPAFYKNKKKIKKILERKIKWQQKSLF